MPAGYGGKNDPAGPRQDSSGRNASSASSPSRGGYNSASSGGNLSSNGLGATTGKTIYGNTAYGPAGGMATGYATRKDSPSGLGPSVGTYSNFRNLDGSAAIPGAGNMTAMGRSAQQARSVLGRQFGGPPRVGGLLDGEQVTVGPIPDRRIVPAAATLGVMPPAPNRYAALQAYKSPYGPEAFSTVGAGMNLFNKVSDAWHNYFGGLRGNEAYDRGYAGGNWGNLGKPAASAGYRWNDTGPSVGGGSGGGGGSGW